MRKPSSRTITPKLHEWAIPYTVLVKVCRSQKPVTSGNLTSSQKGGWDPDTFEFDKEMNAQIDQAFKNVELALTTAGGKGWEQLRRLLLHSTSRHNDD